MHQRLLQRRLWDCISRGARRGVRLSVWSARSVFALSLFAALLSACASHGAISTPATSTRTAGGPSASASANPSATTRGAGINVEPSYRPWRYLDGPAPESWWCAPPNCAPQTAPGDRITMDLQLAHTLGVNMVRVEFPWRFIEPQPGEYDWSRADLIVSEAAANHVNLQPIIVWSPSWVGAPTAAPAPDDFRAFVTALVSRYHTTIHYWELWNEPDLDKYWSAGEQAYVSSILIPGYQGVKAADPAAQVVLGGPSWASGDWLHGIYQYGGGDSFDIMAWHAYGSASDVMSSVDNVLPILADHHQASKPLWIGEFGLADGSNRNSDQASLLTDVLTAHSAIAQADWYTLRDEDAMTCCPPTVAVQGYYGLVERDGKTLKAGYTALQQLISAGLPPVAAAQG
jgi:hypothetical protein